ncbi:MAG: hypothetical protein ACJ8HJ_09475 [Massilia sp.]
MLLGGGLALRGCRRRRVRRVTPPAPRYPG